MMQGGKFGRSGARVLIEECMVGREVTVLCFCDGKTIVPMKASQDHKRVFDGDKGPNTGGMGAFAPSRCIPGTSQSGRNAKFCCRRFGR